MTDRNNTNFSIATPIPIPTKPMTTTMSSTKPAKLQASGHKRYNSWRGLLSITSQKIDTFMELVRNAPVPILIPHSSCPQNASSSALAIPLLSWPLSHVPTLNQLHPQVSSVPNGRSRPLSDGPLGWTYIAVSTRPHQQLESFLPPSDYSRGNASLLSLVVSSCEPNEDQVITATPGAEHAMTVENKKKQKVARLMKSAKKLRRFFKRGQY